MEKKIKEYLEIVGKTLIWTNDFQGCLTCIFSIDSNSKQFSGKMELKIGKII
jgi:carbon monoxide dehydrogenase subunit G